MTAEDENFFTNVIGSSSVVTDTDDIEHYNIDWMRTVRGQSKVILFKFYIFCVIAIYAAVAFAPFCKDRFQTDSDLHAQTHTV